MRRLTQLLMALSVGSIAFSGWVAAAPEARDVSASVNQASAEVWGDPEENADTEQTWTWFGMGYEQRTEMMNRQGVGGGSGEKGGGRRSSK